jgi:hypothetical protein
MKKMEKKLFFILVLSFLMIPFVFAAPTTTIINVHTLPSHRIYIAVLVPEETIPYQVIESFAFKDTGILGTREYRTTSSYGKIDLKITVKLGDIKVLDERIKNISTGRTVYIDYFKNNITVRYEGDVITTEVDTANVSANVSENDTAIASNNETQENTPVTEEKEEEKQQVIEPKNNSLTGNLSLGSFYTNYSKIITYISLSIIIIVIIVLVIFFILKNRKKTKKEPVTAVKFRHKDNIEYSQTERELEAAEKKLREARDEIERARKRNDMIKEAERKLEEDKVRLDNLRRGN